LSIVAGPAIPLSWDTIGYYVYFTELITDGDLAIQNLDYYAHIISTYENSNSFYQFVWLKDGGMISKYTSGWAILNAPFMYIGHLFAGWLGYPQDGYSTPYQIAVQISSLFYTFVGLILTRKLLLKFFSDKISAILLLILVLGTNYLHMNYGCLTLVHVYLLPLYAALLLLTIRFHKEKNWKDALLIGLTIGIMTLVRPTEILAAIIPLLYGVSSLKTLYKRLKDVFTTKHYITSILVFTTAYSIQLFYWKYTTGHFLYFTYKNPGEGLDLNNPHLFDLLFSFRKGWLIYTPIMIFAFLGFVKLYKYNKQVFWSVVIFFFTNLYVVSSWSNWWYAASFSQRALVQVYVICLIPIGYLLIKLTGWKKYTIGTLLALFITLNLFQTWQVEQRIIHMDRMSKEYYFSIFGQTSSPTEKQKDLLLIDRGLSSFDNPEEYSLIRTERLAFEDLELSSNNPYAPPIRIPYNELTSKDHLWIIIRARIEKAATEAAYKSEPLALHLCGNMLNEHGVYRWTCENLSEFNENQIQLQHEYLTPDLRSTSDTVAIGMWHQFGPAVKVSELSIDVYEHK
jgi:hypothetical protein